MCHLREENRDRVQDCTLLASVDRTSPSMRISQIGNFIGDALAGRHIQIAGDGLPEGPTVCGPSRSLAVDAPVSRPQASFHSM